MGETYSKRENEDKDKEELMNEILKHAPYWRKDDRFDVGTVYESKVTLHFFLLQNGFPNEPKTKWRTELNMKTIECLKTHLIHKTMLKSQNLIEKVTELSNKYLDKLLSDYEGYHLAINKEGDYPMIQAVRLTNIL